MAIKTVDISDATMKQAISDLFDFDNNYFKQIERPYNDLDNMTSPGMYRVSAGITNSPGEGIVLTFVCALNNGVFQLYIGYQRLIQYRVKWYTFEWTVWKKLHD